MKRRKHKRTKSSLDNVGRALVRARLAARKIARAYGTPIYIWRDGKVVAEKP